VWVIGKRLKRIKKVTRIEVGPAEMLKSATKAKKGGIGYS